jgi:hypothetical protein
MCPNFIPPVKSRDKRCAECEEYYPPSEMCVLFGRAYCTDCISEMTVSDIIRISEIESVKEFVDLIEGRLVRVI